MTDVRRIAYSASGGDVVVSVAEASWVVVETFVAVGGVPSESSIKQPERLTIDPQKASIFRRWICTDIYRERRCDGVRSTFWCKSSKTSI